jgi:uncharacterized protein (UPF0335 family)
MTSRQTEVSSLWENVCEVAESLPYYEGKAYEEVKSLNYIVDALKRIITLKGLDGDDVSTEDRTLVHYVHELYSANLRLYRELYA